MDGRRHPEGETVPECRDCRHFLGASRELEAELPGLTILSSAYGDSMGDQGLCRLHQQLVPARHTCSDFRAYG